MRPGDAAQGWLSFLPHGLTGCCGDEAGRRLWKGLWGTVGPCVCVGGPYACVNHLEEVGTEAGPVAAGEETPASPGMAFEERGVQA